MASEPKKPIEQMLEALAKARRAQFGDDPKMPNPMRARLHEEIARAGLAEDEKAESRPSWLTMFWPRVTVAAALATLIVLVPAIWWNQSHPVAGKGELALRDHTAAPSEALNSAVPAKDTVSYAAEGSATEATVNLADNNQVKIEPAATPTSESEALKSSTYFAQGGASTELRTEATKEFDKQIASAKVLAAPAAAPPVGADSESKSDTIAAVAPAVAQPASTGNLATAQRFSQRSAVQSFRNSAQANRAANVLNTFQVQQQGNDIRVVDADGSTYTGRIEQSVKGAEVDSRLAARRAMAKETRRGDGQNTGESQSTAPQSYFRATGYNVSLKKTLVFEGNYEASPPQQPTTSESNDRQQAEQSRDRARIVGTVRVSGEAPVTVDAIAESTEPAGTKKSDK